MAQRIGTNPDTRSISPSARLEGSELGAADSSENGPVSTGVVGDVEIRGLAPNSERESAYSESGRPSLSERLSFALRPSSHLGSFASVGLFVIVGFVGLYIARSICVPLVFALMLYFLLRPAVRGLARVHLPRAVAGALVLGGAIAIATAIAVELAAPASSWAERLPVAMRELETKSRVLRRPMEHASRLAESVERVTDLSRSGVPEVAVVKPSWFDGILASTAELGAELVIALIAAYFLLLDGDRLLSRIFRLLPDLRDRERAGAVINEVERRMSQYLRTVSAINAGLGVFLGLALMLLGMPNPWLWAGMAALLNYVPYLGPGVGIVVVGLASFVTFPTAGAALLPPFVYLLACSVEGNLITPLVLGRAFKINPLVVFAWLVFWAWLWGIPGAILAVPLLMLITIVCEQSSALSPFARLVRA